MILRGFGCDFYPTTQSDVNFWYIESLQAINFIKIIEDIVRIYGKYPTINRFFKF